MANPADQAIYYYMGGHGRAYGDFQQLSPRTKGRAHCGPKPARESRGSIRPGEATQKRKYDVAFLLDSPRVIHCFSAEAKLNPWRWKKRPRAVASRIAAHR